MKTDIADPESAQAAVDATLDRFGTVDILVNNAAIYGDYVGSDHSLEYLKQVFDVNLHGQWVMAKVVAPHLVEQRWGRIINVASIAAYLHQLSAVATPTTSSSATTRTCSRSGACSGSPGTWPVNSGSSTSPSTASLPGSPTPRPPRSRCRVDFQPMFATMSAMRRNTEPEHMVGPAVFFASSDADLVNGQVLVVDGGNVMPV